MTLPDGIVERRVSRGRAVSRLRSFPPGVFRLPLKETQINFKECVVVCCSILGTLVPWRTAGSEPSLSIDPEAVNLCYDVHSGCCLSELKEQQSCQGF